ncbi:MAG TPA: LLM class flavin-dependent oxidoreductase [Candidatus Sulfotelmatobacter sp.]|nr:LLM class flavin-dependent oxidoreductase [Candidatus Sulfotelmatobacter sp.]
MVLKIGYLLPTRESVMEGRPQTAPLLALAERAEALGYDSLWIGDSLLARPRHDPLTLLAAAAARTRRVALGTAVLLPALRNPVVLAQQVSTLDQIAEGRIILGMGIASDLPNIRAEFAAAGVPFEKRVGRMLEGLQLCRALWSGKPVDWDGRWPVKGGVLGPLPYRPGGPPIWLGGTVRASLERVAQHFDGWFPNKPDAAWYAGQWAELGRMAAAAGRPPGALTGAAYLTLAIDDDAARAERRMNGFIENYYGQAAAMMRARQATFAGPAAAAAEWLRGYAAAGASHLVLRFAGNAERQLEAVARLRLQIAA